MKKTTNFEPLMMDLQGAAPRVSGKMELEDDVEDRISMC